jgi:hypothetical protein
MDRGKRKRSSTIRSGSRDTRSGQSVVSNSDSTKRDRDTKTSAAVMDRTTKRFKSALASLAKK